MRTLFVFLLIHLFCPTAYAQTEVEKIGLLVMAHGGSDEWNAAIQDAVNPLREIMPVSVALGMANPVTLHASLIELEEQDVTSIKVVRLFVSAESFLPETEYAFGLREDKPQGHFMFEPVILERRVPISINSHGLMEAFQVAGILRDRAAELSQKPEKESVLIIAHGPGDDEENTRWISKMNELADSVRADANYHSVRVATLREDWTGKRELAEQALREFVITESESGRTVLVVPFRLFGFGPYAEVLEGLSYSSSGVGFLPDSRIKDWIMEQFESEVSPSRTSN